MGGADSSVVLAELLGNVIISNWVLGLGHSPALQILLQISVKTSVMVSPPALISSTVPGILSFSPFYNVIMENIFLHQRLKRPNKVKEFLSTEQVSSEIV